MEEIKIPLSKNKMYLMLLGAIVFVACGIWFVIDPPKIDNLFFGNPTLLFITGIVSILFFGLVMISLLRKLPQNKPGMIINAEGITDNSSGVSVGLISWSDILEIKTTMVMNQKFVLIMVKNPEHYINLQKGMIKRKAMQVNYKSYGTPINISANTLNTNFDSLSEVLNQKFKEYRN